MIRTLRAKAYLIGCFRVQVQIASCPNFALPLGVMHARREALNPLAQYSAEFGLSPATRVHIEIRHPLRTGFASGSQPYGSGESNSDLRPDHVGLSPNRRYRANTGQTG